MGRSWDVFCKVVDNYGDAAVCWRLARQLAREHDGRVRLWIDDPAPLAALRPDLDPRRDAQRIDSVEVRRLTGAGPADPAEIVIDGFGGGLPEACVEAMARPGPDGRPRSLWIVLEYLSAESWVASHHGLPSPHPRLPLARWFFFPGFVEGTGGVPHEADYAARRARFDARAFWASLGMGMPERSATVVSLFGYENPVLAPLLDAWAAGPAPVLAVVPRGRLSAGVEVWARNRGQRRGPVSGPHGAEGVFGALELRALPFLSQDRYDELLWACDWNFVRGEDSFVRAQLAAKPFVWQVYPQAEGAHLAKLAAFFGLWSKGLPGPANAGLDRLWKLWNGVGIASFEAARAWAGAAAAPDALAVHAAAWAGRLATGRDLATTLARFCEDQLK